MAVVDASWPSVWRAHRSVFVLWLVACAVVVAMVIVAVVSGLDRPFYVLLAVGTVLQLLHGWVIERLSSRRIPSRPIP
jgi:hypothetical protein